MAVFKYGAFITDIAGSVGGTTFKRSPTLPVIQNKSFGGSKSKLFSNNQLNGISLIWSKWSKLTSLERTDWNYQATQFQFLDKFGNLKNLTGRQLFTKLNIQLLPVGSEVLDPTVIHNDLSAIELQEFDLTISPFLAELQLDVTGADNWILVQIEVSLRNIQAPQFTRRKISAFVFGNGAIGFDITSQILEQFPYINDNYNVRAFVTLMNVYGFKNTTQYFDGSWIV